MRLEFRDGGDTVLSAFEFEPDPDSKGELLATGFYGSSSYAFGPRDGTLVIRVTGVQNVKAVKKSELNTSSDEDTVDEGGESNK